MQRRNFLRLAAAAPLLPPLLARAGDDEFVIAVNRTTIESSALLIQKIPGVRVIPLPSGRAASAQLVAGKVDAASGNETQALVASASRPELRVVLTLAECRYRIVARRSAGIAGNADLRGKRIAFTPNTSSQYFLLDLLRATGVKWEEFTPATMEPELMPAALAEGRIDAMAIWEPQPQIALDRLGTDAIVLTNSAPNAYFERFGLNTTAAVLQDTRRRAVIVNALRAIHAMSAKLAADPQPFMPAIAQAVGVSESVVQKAWPQFRFPGRFDDTLLPMFDTMEPWAAANARRAARTHDELARVLDGSAAREAGL
ncbi:MAG TPA: ABC transporter substrate-binding protein [Burkholderiales bacterium]